MPRGRDLSFLCCRLIFGPSPPHTAPSLPLSWCFFSRCCSYCPSMQATNEEIYTVELANASGLAFWPVIYSWEQFSLLRMASTEQKLCKIIKESVQSCTVRRKYLLSQQDLFYICTDNPRLPLTTLLDASCREEGVELNKTTTTKTLSSS